MSNYSNTIEIKELSKKFNGFNLNRISFNVEKGTIMGFVGENGAGKTTTIKLILNMMKIDSGEISIFGLDGVKEDVKIKEEIGVVFDDICFPESFNMKNLNVVFKGVYRNWSEEKFWDFVQRFDLPKTKKIKSFSRGMKMKASIAVALSHNAKLLILDEPTSGLDPMIRNDILDILLDFMVDEEHTIIFSTHITSDLERIADTITFIHKGEVILSQDKLEMLENHGVLKCSKEQYNGLDKASVVEERKSSFGYEVLVNDKDFYTRNYPNLVIDKATIEDIMVFYARKG